MKVDYIIVGLGLAGIAFSKELEANYKSFVVFENNSQNSSEVAGGVYNPVVLKRFTPVWEANNQLEIALPFYQELENKFKKPLEQLANELIFEPLKMNDTDYIWTKNTDESRFAIGYDEV